MSAVSPPMKASATMKHAQPPHTRGGGTKAKMILKGSESTYSVAPTQPLPS